MHALATPHDWYPDLPPVKLREAREALTTLRARLLFNKPEREILTGLAAKIKESLEAKEPAVTTADGKITPERNGDLLTVPLPQ